MLFHEGSGLSHIAPEMTQYEQGPSMSWAWAEKRGQLLPKLQSGLPTIQSLLCFSEDHALRKVSCAGSAAFLGLFTQHKSLNCLSGGSQLKLEEHWEPQTTYIAISNACTNRVMQLLRPCTATRISEKVFWFKVFIPTLELGQWASYPRRFLPARCSFHSSPVLQELSSAKLTAWFLFLYL